MKTPVRGKKTEKTLYLRKKIFLISGGLCLGIISLELFLRLAGCVYNAVNHMPKEKSANCGILCVGESTTWGVGASDPANESYPKRLQELLKEEYPDKDIRCFYDQAIGQNTSEVLLKLPGYIRRYRPRLIIFMVGANNWWNLNRSNVFLFNHDSRISRCALKMYVFLDKFRVWKLLKWVTFSIKGYNQRWNRFFPKNETPKSLTEKTIAFYGKDILDVFDTVAKIDISRMIEITLAHDIKAVMCSYPSPVKDGLYRLQIEIAEKYNVPFVDNYSFFKELPDVFDYISDDHWHPNTKGYEAVAGYIYEAIVRNRLLE